MKIQKIKPKLKKASCQENPEIRINYQKARYKNNPKIQIEYQKRRYQGTQELYKKCKQINKVHEMANKKGCGKLENFFQQGKQGPYYTIQYVIESSTNSL